MNCPTGWLRSGLSVAVLAACCTVVSAADLPTQEFPLWEKETPGAKGDSPKDIPTLTPFYPAADKATGAVFVVCPGGGYGGLAGHEGAGYAHWFNEMGITAFVLKYRLGSAGYRHPIMLGDVSRAIRYVRANAKSWNLDPARIGVIGSSAGGHLASTVLTHFDSGKADASDPIDRVSSRPDIGILCYPVITMGDKTHGGSKRNLLGENPDPELVELLSNEKQVTKETPPTLLFHTAEDKAVPVENSLMFAASLAKHGVPFALHVYPKGSHGMGLGGRSGEPASRHPWTSQCAIWLKEQGFAK